MTIVLSHLLAPSAMEMRHGTTLVVSDIIIGLTKHLACGGPVNIDVGMKSLEQALIP